MKRQADGVRLSDDTEPTEENGNKRIKLLNNESNKEKFQGDHGTEKSVMDVSLHENSHGHCYEDAGSSILNDASPSEHDDISSEKATSENYSIQSMHEIESTHENLSETTNYCNGESIESLADDSIIVSELHLKNSVQCSDENTVCDNKELDPPCLNRYDHDLQYSESTDSFQSEGFAAQNTRVNSENGTAEKPKDSSSSNNEVSEKPMAESNCDVSNKRANEINNGASEKSEADTNEIVDRHASQKQDNNHEKDVSFESDTENIIDVDNLSLSHLKVTELLGHTEEVFSVTADEDFILSSSADTTTKVWNMERQNIISTFSGHSSHVTAVLLLNPNQSKKIKKKMSLTKVSRIAITGSLDCHIKLWSVLEGKELASVYTFNGITCLGYLDSESLVVVGTEGGKLEIWNLASKKAIISEKAHEDKVTDIKVIDNHIYSVSLDGSVKVWSYEDEDIFPVYCRKRKEISSDGKNQFKPAQWETVAVCDNIMYLGDGTNSIKMLDWKAGKLTLFKNQIKKQGICNCVLAKEKILFSSYHDSFSKTSGINVWKLPEMTYVCTIDGSFPKINNLAAVQKENKLKVITGGDKLFICEFDFSKPPSTEGEFYVHEHEMLGYEINENPVEIKKAGNSASNASISDENHSSNKWCNVM